MSDRPKIVIAGASGFIGRGLIDRLRAKYDIIGLSRSPRESSAEVEWRKCDLFSLMEAENAVKGAAYAIYLVHSMLPSSRLTQGSFEDLDLIAADNFARACSIEGVEQIIYLGGLLEEDEELSRHLESRREVEITLADHSVNVTCLRAGMIIGAEGSSFQMLLRLVKHLPIMLLPRWTRTLTQPIDYRDVLSYIEFCLANDRTYGECFDIGCPESMSYESMILRTAKIYGRVPMTFHVPIFSPQLSTFWVSMVTGTSISLVSPLVDSLQHRMVIKDSKLSEMAGFTPRSFDESVADAIEEDRVRQMQPIKRRPSRRKAIKEESRVRSVQRLVLPSGMRAIDVMDEYVRWLPKFLRFLIYVAVSKDAVVEFKVSLIEIILLRLEMDHDRSLVDRPLLRIRGGVLSNMSERSGRLEFREVLKKKFVIAAIHNYRPRLPWFLYNLLQASAHLVVMKAFNWHLKRKSAALAKER